MTDWYDLVPPVKLDVAVDGAVIHQVEWQSGRLVLHDHDVAAEKTLIALGSQACLCLDIADLWYHLDEDWRVLRSVLVDRSGRARSLDGLPAAQRRRRALLEPQPSMGTRATA